jgi:hypothetical protein
MKRKIFKTKSVLYKALDKIAQCPCRLTNHPEDPNFDCGCDCHDPVFYGTYHVKDERDNYRLDEVSLRSTYASIHAGYRSINYYKVYIAELAQEVKVLYYTDYKVVRA